MRGDGAIAADTCSRTREELTLGDEGMEPQ
jgi:hypothetical protein